MKKIILALLWTFATLKTYAIEVPNPQQMRTQIYIASEHKIPEKTFTQTLCDMSERFIQTRFALVTGGLATWLIADAVFMKIHKKVNKKHLNKIVSQEGKICDLTNRPLVKKAKVLRAIWNIGFSALAYFFIYSIRHNIKENSRKAHKEAKARGCIYYNLNNNGK